MQALSDPLLTILTVNYNTSDFIEVMLHAFTRLTTNPYKVIICDNGSDDRHLLHLARVAQAHSNVVVVFRKQSAPGSIGHGEAMDLLLDMVDTPYFVTMDADASFLIKGWDELLLSRLQGNVKAVGTQAPGDKPKDFPLMFAVLYETATFRRVGAGFMPRQDPRAPSSLGDTGCEIRERFQQQGYSGDVLEFRNTRTWKEGPFSDLLAAEFYMAATDSIVASHYGRGSTGGLAKYQSWWRRIPVVGALVARYRAACARQAWIARVRDIADANT